MVTDLVQTYVIPIALRILLAVVVWLVGRWLARRSRGWLTEYLEHTELTESFVTLITTLAFYGILILAALLALAAVGVPVTILGAALGVVIIVLAITLQTSLGNLAATVIILLFKPLRSERKWERRRMKATPTGFSATVAEPAGGLLLQFRSLEANMVTPLSTLRGSPYLWTGGKEKKR